MQPIDLAIAIQCRLPRRLRTNNAPVAPKSSRPGANGCATTGHPVSMVMVGSGPSILIEVVAEVRVRGRMLFPQPA